MTVMMLIVLDGISETRTNDHNASQSTCQIGCYWLNAEISSKVSILTKGKLSNEFVLNSKRCLQLFLMLHCVNVCNSITPSLQVAKINQSCLQVHTNYVITHLVSTICLLHICYIT